MNPSLWDVPAPYSEPTTSRDAALSMADTSRAVRELIYTLLAETPGGLTCWEIEEATGLSHQTVSARLWELAGQARGHKACIEKTAERRMNPSGRKARVYRVCL